MLNLNSGITIKVIIAALLAAGLLTLSACSKEPEDRPDIVLITLDTTRWDYIRSYGYETPNSPNLDKLAAMGSRYLNAITVAGTTFPAHGSMLSGLYPRSHGARSNFHRLGDNVTTVAEILSDNGYQTGSFVSFKGMHYIGNLDRGFKTVSDRTIGKDKEPTRLGSETLDMTLDWLTDTSTTEPMFLWMHLFEPHGPYDITPWFKSNFADYSGIFQTGVSVSQVRNGRHNNYDQKDIEAMRQIYAGEVHLADQYVGELIEQLKLRGNLDNTLVIITSDHGQGMGENSQFGHGALLWESVLRVPLIIVDFRNPSRAVIDQRVGIVDIAPTILAGANINTTATMAGRSLYPLDNPANGEDRLYYAEVALIENPDAKTRRWYNADDLAVYLGEFKLEFRRDKFKLFSTTTDKNQLSRIPKGKAESLFYYLSDSVSAYLETAGHAQPASLDTQTLKDLQGLGYTQ